MPGHLICQIRYSFEIVQASRGSDTGGISHTIASDGNAMVFKLNRNGSELWLNDNYANPQNRWNLDNRIVFRLRNSLHFPAFSLEETGFRFSLRYSRVCPYQPPSIFPASSIPDDSVRYFLSSIEPVSHKIISNTFAVSVFRVARRIHGNFSSFDRNIAVTEASMASMNSLSMRLPSEYFWDFGTSS